MFNSPQARLIEIPSGIHLRLLTLQLFGSQPEADPFNLPVIHSLDHPGLYRRQLCASEEQP
jgi:hypothetical protein